MRRYGVMTALQLTRAAIVLATLAGSPAHTVAQEGTVPQPTVELPTELDRVLRDYERAWGARDAARLASLFHADGFVLSTGSPPVRGRENITRHYNGAGGELHLRPIAYATQDTIGYIVGVFRGSSPVEGGKFLLALRRSARNQPWLIAADMDNRNSR